MNRLDRLKQMQCCQCHAPAPSDPCHANWAEFGKGMGKKAHDEYTIPLCRACHKELDTYVGRSRQRAKDWFLDKLYFVNQALNEQDNPSEYVI